MKKLFYIFSYIFHPVLIPLLVTGCLYYMTYSYYDIREIYITLFQVAIMGLCLPMAIFMFLKSLKMISTSIMIHDSNERKAPVFLNIVLMYILTYHILSLNRNLELKLFFIGYGFSYLLIFISLYFKKKYSLHMLGFSAFIVCLLHVAQSFFLPFIIPMCILMLLLGMIGTSRLALQAHTTKELLFGTLIGIIPQLVIHRFPNVFL